METTKNSSCRPSFSKMSTAQMVSIALFTAIAAALSYLEIPLIPAAPYLKYDPSGIVSLIVAMVYGPLAGVLVAILSWVPHMLTNPIGAVLNICAAVSLIVPASLIYRGDKTMRKAIIGMSVGILASLTVSIGLNFIATPLYFGGSIYDVVKLVIPILIPFNLIKLFLNCGVTLLVYKQVSKMVQNFSRA